MQKMPIKKVEYYYDNKNDEKKNDRQQSYERKSKERKKAFGGML